MSHYDRVAAQNEAFRHLSAVVASDGDAAALYTAASQAFEQAVGFSLYTVMLFDPAHSVTKRVYTSDAGNYPVGGTKPLERDAWYQRVVTQALPFVANTPEEWRPYYIDYEKVFSLGLRSAVNAPVRVGGAVVGSVNLLHADRPYAEEDAAVATTLAELLGAGLRLRQAA